MFLSLVILSFLLYVLYISFAFCFAPSPSAVPSTLNYHYTLTLSHSPTLLYLSGKRHKYQTKSNEMPQKSTKTWTKNRGGVTTCNEYTWKNNRTNELPCCYRRLPTWTTCIRAIFLPLLLRKTPSPSRQARGLTMLTHRTTTNPLNPLLLQQPLRVRVPFSHKSQTNPKA